MVSHLWCEYDRDGSDITYLVPSGCHYLTASWYRCIAFGTNSYMCISLVLAVSLTGHYTDVVLCVLLQMSMKAFGTKRPSGLIRYLGTVSLKLDIGMCYLECRMACMPDLTWSISDFAIVISSRVVLCIVLWKPRCLFVRRA